MLCAQLLWRWKVWLRTSMHGPLQDPSHTLRFRIPRQAVSNVRHSLSPQLLEPAPIVGQFRQNPFNPRDDVILGRQRDLVPHLSMNDISRPPEVRDHRNSAGSECFEHDACAVVAKRWKHEHISRSEALDGFRMREPAAELNGLLNPKRLRQLLEAGPRRATTHHRPTGDIAARSGG